MNSTLLIIKQSLKKRKKQYLFLSVTLFLSTILFAIAIHLISAVEKPFDDSCFFLMQQRTIIMRSESGMSNERKSPEFPSRFTTRCLTGDFLPTVDGSEPRYI